MELHLAPPSERSRGGNHRHNGGRENVGNPLEGILNLPSFQLQLMPVVDVLHPAAAATDVIGADRRDPVAGRGYDPDKPPPGVPFSDLGDLDLHLIPVNGKGHKNDKTGNPGDAVAAERDIPDHHPDEITDPQNGIHLLEATSSFRPPLPQGETGHFDNPLLESS
jgi:hypothetical protein